MKHFLVCVLAPVAILAQTSAPPARPAPGTSITAAAAPDPVVLAVGDQKITRSQFDAIIAGLPANQRQRVEAPGGKRKLAGEIGQVEALAIEARARKLEENPVVAQMVRLQHDGALANALVKEEMAADGSNATALHDYYDKHPAEFEQVKASHILIRFKGSPVPLRKDEKDLTDAEALAKAQEIRQKLTSGGDFAALAKTESDDTGSGAKGGELPAFGHGQMVAEFEKVAFAMKPGEISQPVKTQFGYHIIKVESIGPRPFDQAKPEIESKLAQAFVDNVTKQFPLTLDETYFGH